MNLNELLSLIIPLYNNYKSSIKEATPLESLKIQWQIGDFLDLFIKETKIAPHNLYRSVYGKSEGKTNIVQKSYMSREFLSRCYRVRGIFQSIKEIDTTLPTLSYLNAFREAMPFFDNKKYLLRGKERKELIKLLNDQKSFSDILKKIKELQKRLIGITNPRTQKLQELEAEKRIFIEFYNHIYRLIKNNSYEIVAKEIQSFGLEELSALIRNTDTLSQDGLKTYPIKIPSNCQSPWLEYVQMVGSFVIQQNAVLVRRFRRLILPERISRLSEMLYALSSEERYKSFFNKLNSEVK